MRNVYLVSIAENLNENKTQAVFLAEQQYKPLLEPGGHWKPPDCVARQRVAIVIPYRNREEHLKLFVSYMHPFLQKQSIEYQIFVVEQVELVC